MGWIDDFEESGFGPRGPGRMARKKKNRKRDDGTAERLCSRCKEWKLASEYFSMPGIGKKQLQAFCKDCSREHLKGLKSYR